ncbi:MarR family transcriptional regulator [Amycolatopsis sp.]|jgi:DNA-binding MarR family transcriptional regulator|uniref:MarR family winged helix-turn-helix transcriptional regulator n=1 Tax=Amycolatopsis sp. TaxID=37632 RepID=UPI002E0C6C8C|nr:MarR family transcriptional regulator [Amycolatopsis sp.]
MTETLEETEFASALVRLSQVVQRVLADVSREHGLTAGQTQLLGMLVAGPVEPAELSGLLSLEEPEFTALVDQAEQAGLVTRTPDSAIALTPEGTRIGTESRQAVTARLEELAAELQPADKRTASDVSETLVRHATTAEPTAH